MGCSPCEMFLAGNPYPCNMYRVITSLLLQENLDNVESLARTIARSQRLISYSFSKQEMSLLSSRGDFRTKLASVQTLADAEGLIAMGQRIINEMGGSTPFPT